MNRKERKKRKMQLKRLGLEAFIPNPFSKITTTNGQEIISGKLREYEFIRPILEQK